MDNRTHDLMKYFALVLKRRIKDEQTPTIDENLLKYLSRKELIEIIQYKENGNTPDSDKLMEMENEQLLQLIGDELFVLAYMSRLWCKQLAEKPATRDKAQPLKADEKNDASGKVIPSLSNEKKSS